MTHHRERMICDLVLYVIERTFKNNTFGIFNNAAPAHQRSHVESYASSYERKERNCIIFSISETCEITYQGYVRKHKEGYLLSF